MEHLNDDGFVQFLSVLAIDEQFRRDFEANPQIVMTRAGLSPVQQEAVLNENSLVVPRAMVNQENTGLDVADFPRAVRPVRRTTGRTPHRGR
jgi:hypothetical protein